MDVGDTREFVLICVMDNGLVSFEDRREDNYNFDSKWMWLDERPVDGLESVEIRLIDRKTKVAKTFMFRVWYDGGHFKVAPR
jgi:hypothetical protein